MNFADCGLSFLIFAPLAGAAAMLVLPRQMGKALAVLVSLAVLAAASWMGWEYKKNPGPTLEATFQARIAELQKADPKDTAAKAEIVELQTAVKSEQAK